jgi:hypothetical protein
MGAQKTLPSEESAQAFIARAPSEARREDAVNQLVAFGSGR